MCHSMEKIDVPINRKTHYITIYIFLINVKVIFYYSLSKQHLDKVLGGKTTI